MAKNISLYKPNIPVTRNIYGVQTSGFMPEELEQIKDAASQKASKEKAKKEKKRKELEQKKAEEDRIRKANEKWVKNIKDQIAKAKSEGVDTSELEKQLAEYTKPKYHTDNVKIEDISTDVDMFPSDAEMQDIEEEAKSEKEISLAEFGIDDIKGIKSFEEMQKVDPKITKKDYQHAVNAWHIAQKVGEKIGVDPRLLFGQFGVETLFRDRSVLEQYNYGNIKHFDKYGKNVPQYEGQKSYTDNLNGSEDYYLRFNTIDEAIDWYAQRYAEDGGSRHSLKGDAKTDPLAFSKSLYESRYYEGDPNLTEAQRPIVYQRGIVGQVNKWLSGDPLTAIQYKDDPYYTDPVEAIADSKEEPQSESVSAAGTGTANLNKGSLFHGGIQAPVAGGLLAGSNIASVPAMKREIKAPTIDELTAQVYANKPEDIQAPVLKAPLLSINPEPTEPKARTIEDVDSLTKATKGANAINAINAAVGLGLGIYGASQINKMQRPSMVSAPQIEAAKIRDTGAQAMAARKGMIEQSANTSREAFRRAGRSDLNATITAGETRALNEAAGAIEGMRTNINAANVAAENRIREINASTKMQADQFNSQIQSAFNQFKSQLGTQNLSTTVQNISGNLGGIAQNIYAKELRLRDEKMQKYAIEMGAV